MYLFCPVYLFPFGDNAASLEIHGVTVITGFVGISQAEKERLAKDMQKACGAGGTVKEGRIEIQGDHRDTVARILANAGFRPVFAGG